MPIYEYQCRQCGHELEALQKHSEAPLVDCPSCHESSLQKLVSAASFRLKGAGWYETDFKSGDKKHLAETESEKSDSSDASEPAKSDSGKNGDSADTAAKADADAGKQKAVKSTDKDSGKSAAGEKSGRKKPTSDKGGESTASRPS